MTGNKVYKVPTSVRGRSNLFCSFQFVDINPIKLVWFHYNDRIKQKHLYDLDLGGLIGVFSHRPMHFILSPHLSQYAILFLSAFKMWFLLLRMVCSSLNIIVGVLEMVRFYYNKVTFTVILVLVFCDSD